MTSDEVGWDETDTEKSLEFSKDYEAMEKKGFDDYGEFMQWVDEHDSAS